MNLKSRGGWTRHFVCICPGLCQSEDRDCVIRFFSLSSLEIYVRKSGGLEGLEKIHFFDLFRWRVNEINDS